MISAANSGEFYQAVKRMVDAEPILTLPVDGNIMNHFGVCGRQFGFRVDGSLGIYFSMLKTSLNI